MSFHSMSFHSTPNDLDLLNRELNRLGEPTRRSFVSSLAKSMLGVGALPLLQGAVHAADQETQQGPKKGKAKRIIYLYMNGGMSHLDTFDTKPGTDTQGPVESIDTNVTGLKVSEYFHRTAQHMDKVAVLNSLNSTQGAHEQGRYFMHTSYFLRGTITHPDLGAWTSKLLPQSSGQLPSNVKIGGGLNSLGAGFFESRHAALPIGNPESGLQHSSLPKGVTEDRFQRRLARVRQMNNRFRKRFDQKDVRAVSSMYDSAVKLMKSEDLKAFDLSLESDTIRDRYGEDAFGQGCLLARRLVERDVRFVEVAFGGWDTHVNNFEVVAEKSEILDQALSALLGDLSERGLLDETLVVLATEFGRTPEIVTARSNGRNHYPKAFTCLLAGGGIRGGERYGKTDSEGREVVDGLIEVPDFNATIAHAIGLPVNKEVYSPSRRPFKVADKGKPIFELFG